MESDDSLPDLLTLAQLKQVANMQPQPYRVQAQVESAVEKQTQANKPYYEVKLTDGEESLVWRVFDGSPLFLEAANLARQAWIELTAQWVDTGKFGLDPRQPVMRKLTADEVQHLLNGTDQSRQRQLEDYGEISTRIAALADPRLRGLGDVEHGTGSGEHLRLFLGDATQRIESDWSAKSDLGDRQSAGQQRARQRHGVIRIFDSDDGNDAPAPKCFGHHGLLRVHLILM